MPEIECFKVLSYGKSSCGSFFSFQLSGLASELCAVHFIPGYVLRNFCFAFESFHANASLTWKRRLKQSVCVTAILLVIRIP